jgi:hypothetical protein
VWSKKSSALPEVDDLWSAETSSGSMIQRMNSAGDHFVEELDFSSFSSSQSQTAQSASLPERLLTRQDKLTHCLLMHFPLRATSK